MKGCLVVMHTKVPYGLGDDSVTPGEGGRWLRGRETLKWQAQ